MFNNPGLKSGVIDNELIMGFSPKPELLKYRFKIEFIKNLVVFLLIPYTHILYNLYLLNYVINLLSDLPPYFVSHFRPDNLNYISCQN